MAATRVTLVLVLCAGALVVAYRPSVRGWQEDSSEQEGPPLHRMYPVFIPVEFSDGDPAQQRSLPVDPSRPRLIMDKDFNIRFDNPYIIPLTKPLAFVLNRPQGERVMLPFPVLVKERSAREERSQQVEDTAEHRSNDDDDVYLEEPTERSSVKKFKKGPVNYKYKKNGTTTLHETNDPNPIRYKETKPKIPITPDRTEEDTFANSSREFSLSDDLYPGKIFAEMYQKMPKFSVDSRETPRHSYSESSSVQWVTRANSTKGVNRHRRLTDHGTPKTTTTKPISNDIDQKFWRAI